MRLKAFFAKKCLSRKNCWQLCSRFAASLSLLKCGHSPLREVLELPIAGLSSCDVFALRLASILFCMKVRLLTKDENPDILPRIRSLGHDVQAESAHRVVTLQQDTASLVYVIPYEWCQLARWSQLRVFLARASRYYLVFGDGLSTHQIVNAARDGAYDVLDVADSDERWNEAINNAGNSQALWWELYGGRSGNEEEHLVGASRTMRSLRESVARIGPTDATVLIMGESGTGKERVSEAIHRASGKEVFIPVNCAAIPADLMESELFGVEKGAFTGAHRSKRGLVEAAAGGTLFLDEIGEMDFTLQPKLLRFLETRRARRVGSTKEYTCDIRLISATNKDLRAESENAGFRLDLYYRLSEVVINTPPLRHHKSDIADLARVFLNDVAERLGKNFETMEPELVYKFQNYNWPGNVRELKQAIERLAIYYDGPVMREAWWNVPEPLASETDKKPQETSVTKAPFEEVKPSTVRPANATFAFPNKREKMAMARRLLEESDGDLAWTAAQMGIHPTTLYRWRKAGKV